MYCQPPKVGATRIREKELEEYQRMTLQPILDFCSKIEGCSGRITMERDEIYGVSVQGKCRPGFHSIDLCGVAPDHGYCVFTSVKDALYTGRGLTPEEALEKLEEKLKAKFKV